MRSVYYLLLICSACFSEIHVTFLGNVNFSDREIRNQLDLPVDIEKYTDQQIFNILSLSRYNLEVMYENEGYFDTQIILEPHRSNKKRFTFSITEGLRYKYGKILIIDRNKALDQNLPIDFDIKLNSNHGDFYNSAILAKDLDEINYVFKEKGYLQVQIFQSLILDEDNSTLEVIFEAFPGPEVKFNQLNVFTRRKRTSKQKNSIGLSSHEYLKSLWSIAQGDQIKGSQFDSYRQSLLKTGVYSSVQLKLQPIQILDTTLNQTDTLFNVQVKLTERTPGTYISRIFYEQLLGFGVSTNIKHKNVLGALNEISLGGVLAENRYQISSGYGHPFFFKSPYRINTQFTVRRDSIVDPTEVFGYDDRLELINNTTISRKFNEHFRLLILGDLRRIVKYLTEEEAVKARIEPSLQVQFTDRLTDPRKGSKFRFAGGWGGPFKLDQRYFYTEIESDFYHPLGNGILWAGSIDWGKFLDTGDRDDAKLFYLGGFRSLRGYEARSVSPSKDSNYVLNGDTIDVVYGPSPQYLRLSNEFRYNTNLVDNLQLVQFTDWGRIVDLDPEYHKAQEMGVGFGVRYQISLLTLRLDYTFKKTFYRPLGWEKWEFDRISFDLSQAI